VYEGNKERMPGLLQGDEDVALGNRVLDNGLLLDPFLPHAGKIQVENKSTKR